MAQKNASTVKAERDSGRLGSTDDSQLTNLGGEQGAANASAEHGMDISNVGQPAPPIGQPVSSVSTPQPFFSRFGRPNPLFEAAWPFDFPPTIAGTGLAEDVKVPTLSQDPSHPVPGGQAVGKDDCRDVCRADRGTLQTSTDHLIPRKYPSDHVKEEPLSEVDSSLSDSLNPSSTSGPPLFASSRRSKRAQDFTFCDDQSQEDSKILFKTAKEEMDRYQQTGAKTEAVDQEMEDVFYDDQAHNAVQSPPGIGDNTKSHPFNQSSSTVTSVDNPASAYAKLTRVGKRSNRVADLNLKQGQDQDLGGVELKQRRGSQRIDRPFAPPIYARNAGKSKGSRRTELETRKTHYAAEVYKQFANLPNETKECSRSREETLKGIQDLVKSCTDAVRQQRDTTEPFTDLRNRLYQIQFYDFLSKHLIEKTRLFELTSIGAILLQKNNIFPWDIQADARIVAKQVFKYGCDPHLLRGIKTTISAEKNKSYALDEKYPFRTSANYIGAGDLINGQWWPRRICALRDGAHGACEAGIHGETGKGAYSIIVGGDSGYQDLDDGDTLQYCGTSSSKKDGNGASIPTANTRQMLDSCDRIYNQIRVLRSAASSGKHSAYKPSCGLRYDGLYRITGKEHLHVDTSMYRFTLVRCPGQDPIRHKGPEERPTRNEKQEYAKMFK